MTTYLVTDLINTHNLGCQFQDITDPQHTLSSHLISTASQHILSTHTPLSNTHSRLGLPIASCSTPRHLALFQHTFSPHTLSIYLPPTPSQHILSSHTVSTHIYQDGATNYYMLYSKIPHTLTTHPPPPHSQHPFPTHIPGWGYQLLHALLQDTSHSFNTPSPRTPFQFICPPHPLNTSSPLTLSTPLSNTLNTPFQHTYQVGATNYYMPYSKIPRMS